MKTSNKWLLAALLLLVGALTAHNLNLRAEYRRGAYKDPLQDTKTLVFSDFTEIDVQSAHAMGVVVKAGPYSVRVHNEAAPFVKITQQGRRLLVELDVPKDRVPFGRWSDVIISLPRLRRLTAGATYTLDGTRTTERQSRRGRLRIEGFRQDSLRLEQHYATRVTLADNTLNYLQAETGRRPGSQGGLRIERSNRIQGADLRIQSQSELEILAPNLGRLKFQFSDSAKATFAGPGLSNLQR